MNALHNAFISYGRADSKAFAVKLHQILVHKGLKVWFDQNDIPLAVDFQNQIDDGIAKADNFLFVIAPHSVNSRYCLKEIELAIQLNKRIIPLLHLEEIDQTVWQQRYPGRDLTQWEAFKAQGLHSSFVNLHPAISKINWVYFREGVDDFDRSLSGLMALFDRHRDYVRQHTSLLVKAQEWERQHQQSRYLLVGEERVAAAAWLKVQFQDEQPPCEPTDLHCKFITESIKNANSLMTQVFISYDTSDKTIMEQLSKSLMRASFTLWTNRTDIRTGEAFTDAIHRGIEEADNIVYLLSPASLQSAYCQQEIDYALSLNKRIIPLVVAPTDLEQIPLSLRIIQFINFADHQDEGYRTDLAKLLRVLQEDAPYYEQHKLLLTKALKWKRQNYNASILLRGYNLRAAAAWLDIARVRSQQPALPLQAEFITKSLEQPETASLEVFISYSRTDSDFARRLNDALQMQGKTTWFDQESIASGADFQQEIYRGIENSDNFLFIISPRSVNSQYCADEVEYALKLNKRIVTVLHSAVPTASLHPGLASVQWIDFNQHNGDFYANFSELIRTIDTDREHVRSHTKWSQRSLEWAQKGNSPDLLLRGMEAAVAAQWLQNTEQSRKQPAATELQKQFIQASSDAVQAEIKDQKQRLQFLRLLLAMVTVALVVALGQWRRAQVVQEGQINALSRYAEALKNSHQEMQALVEGIRAARQLERQQVEASTQTHVVAALQTAVTNLKESNEFSGHEKGVTSVSFSPAGQPGAAELQSTLIATASFDHTVKLWNLEGQELHTLTGHSAAVNRVVFSPDGQIIATGSDDATVKLWNRDGQELHTLAGHTNWINDISFSPDGQTIATASRDQTVKLWSRDGKLLTTLTEKTGDIYSVSFSPDGQTIATGGYDAIIRLWNRDGQELQAITGHQGAVRSIQFSPNGQLLLSASEDGTAKLWNRNGQELFSFDEHEAGLTRAVFSPDGQTIATASFDGMVKLWNLNGQDIEVLQGHQDWVYDVSFSPDGKTIATASEDQTVKLWNYDPPELISLQGHSDQVTSVGFSPDGQTIATGSFDQTVKLWSADGKELRSLSGHTALISQVSFSSDGQTIATSSYDGTVKLWSLDGKERRTLQGAEQMTSVALSPDGTLLAAGSSDRTVRLWNQNGQTLGTLRGHTDAISSVSFSPDGQTIATGSLDRTVKLWSLDGKEQQTLEHDSLVTDVLFSPDGQTIAVAVDNSTVVLWNAAGEQIRVLEQQGTTTSISFSPDSQIIATGGYERTVTLWSREGRELQTLRGAKDVIYSIAFSPDGKAIAAASADQSVSLWQLNPERLQNSIKLWQLDLKALTAYSCGWVQNYLQHNASLEAADRQLCD